MMDLITDSIISKAEYLGEPLSDPVLLRQNIKEIYMSDSLVGEGLRKSVSQNPDSVEYKSFPKVVLPLTQGIGSSDNESLDSE